MVLFIMFTSGARDLCVQKIAMADILMCCMSNVYKLYVIGQFLYHPSQVTLDGLEINVVLGREVVYFHAHLADAC